MKSLKLIKNDVHSSLTRSPDILHRLLAVRKFFFLVVLLHTFNAIDKKLGQLPWDLVDVSMRKDVYERKPDLNDNTYIFRIHENFHHLHLF